MLEKIKNFLMSYKGSVFVTVLYVIVWGTAWLYNTLCGMHFDLDKLQNMYLSVILPHLAKFGINSGLNSKIGEHPDGGN